MSNSITIDSSIMSVMRTSVYPGAKEDSITMVLQYCKIAKLDPLQKPVHIVPMWIVDKKTGRGEMRDVIMQGVGSYRIQAYRSGMYAGMSEPEFGEDITESIGGKTLTFPKWCKITVKKLLGNHIVEFSAKEYWKENYANSGKDKDTKQIKLAPNDMWTKRPYAQLAKCTEAQVLRKAFPDHVSQAPSAEEMEGKVLEPIESIKTVEKILDEPISIHEPLPSTYRFAELDATFTKDMTVEETLKYLKNKIEALHTPEDDENYLKFKKINAKLINRYSIDNPSEAKDLGNTYKSQIAYIKGRIQAFEAELCDQIREVTHE